MKKIIGSPEIEKILKVHTREQIITICDVCRKTVLNWINKDAIPLSHIKKLGFGIHKNKKSAKSGDL